MGMGNPFHLHVVLHCGAVFRFWTFSLSHVVPSAHKVLETPPCNVQALPHMATVSTTATHHSHVLVAMGWGS